MSQDKLVSELEVIRTHSGSASILIDGESVAYPTPVGASVAIEYPVGEDGLSYPVAYIPVALDPGFDGVVTRYVSSEKFEELVWGE